MKKHVGGFKMIKVVQQFLLLSIGKTGLPPEKELAI